MINSAGQKLYESELQTEGVLMQKAFADNPSDI